MAYAGKHLPPWAQGKGLREWFTHPLGRLGTCVSEGTTGPNAQAPPPDGRVALVENKEEAVLRLFRYVAGLPHR